MSRTRAGSAWIHGAKVPNGVDAKGRQRFKPAPDGVSHWDIRITLSDGSRSAPKCMPVGTTEERARDHAKYLTDLAAEGGGTRVALRAIAAPVARDGDTLEVWSGKWCDERARFGLTSVEDDRGRLSKWITPRLGPLVMAAVQRADLEAFVAWLDEQVLAGKLAAKTAENVWTLVQAMFRDAAGMPGRRRKTPKLPALRVREDNPARDVAGPNAGIVRSKTYLYPSEFLALVSCPRVPIRWRRLFVIGAYTYVRTGELEALQWEDVDLERRIIHVHRAIDRSDGTVKATKTDRPRRIPIEPALVPLLEVMKRDATGPLVVSMPPVNDLAERVRQYLGPGWADVQRAELFANDATRKQIGFYDATRATGISWMAIRGDDPLKIQTRAGHENFETTQGYIREAENLEHDVGDVFPELPASLLESSAESSEGPAYWAKLRGSTYKNVASPAGFEPA